MYTFKKSESANIQASKDGFIRYVYESEKGEMHSLFIGQVIALFGIPDEMNNDYENIFNLDVIGENDRGEKFYFTIYHGSGGPTIAGYVDDLENKMAADELITLIKNAKPADYKWKGIYHDIPVKIKMGVKNGEPYYKSSFSILGVLGII